MISNVKRYKSLLDLAMSEYRKVTRANNHQMDYSNGKIRFDLPNCYRLTYLLLMDTPMLDLHVVEAKNKIYIVANLDKDIKPYVDYKKASTGFDYISYQLYYNFVNGYMFSIENDRNNFYADCNGLDRYALEKNRNKLYETDAYKKVKNELESIANRAKVTMELKSDQYPDLTYRKCLPVMWIDVENGQICTNHKFGTTSHKQGIRRFNLNDISSVKLAAQCAIVEKNLLDVDIQGIPNVVSWFI